MSDDVFAHVAVSGTIALLLYALLVLVLSVAGKSPDLAQMARYHSLWIANAAVLFTVQIAHLLGLVTISSTVLGLWGVLSFALVPVSFFLHVVAKIRGYK